MTKTYNDIEVVTHLLAEVGVSLHGTVFNKVVSNWLIDPGGPVFLLDSGTGTWSWQLGLVSHSCREITCCRNAMRQLRSN